ncbi:extracellular solute-binding protein [Kribbella sp. NPDC050820]|uniref:extracellular solute-binding protein n=1 Tax=Kribbella sp. NPDC050820 TaxID=3155408 RepID=UPI0033E0C830
MSVHDARPLSRRTVLAGATALGLASVAGCSNAGRGGSSAGNDEASRAKIRPAYERYTGVEPDMAGAEYNIPDAFRRYPANPVQAITEPPGDGQPIQVMTPTAWAIPPKVEQNTFWQELNKRVGSPISVNLTPSVDYPKKFATAVAGDQLGDIFTVGAVPQIPQMLAAKATDLSPYLSGDNIKKYPFLANLPEDCWNSAIFNGKIYAIPIPRGAISSSVLYSRADILEAQGLKAEVKSTDDFVELCKALTNGRMNRFALAATPTQYVRNMFDMPNLWRKNGDALVSYLEHEAHEEVLEILQKLWKSGYIHPDAYSGQNTDLKTRFANGSSPLVQDTFSAWPTYLQKMTAPNARIATIPPPKHDGSGMGRTWLGRPAIYVTAISKKAEPRVETLLSYLNYLATPFGTQEYLFRKYGLAGIHHQMVDGNPVISAKGFSETQLGLQYEADAPWTIFLPEREGSADAEFNAMKAVCPDAIANPAAGLYSETDVRKGQQLTDAVNQVADDIVQGRKPVSAWRDAVKKWKNDGGDRIADELAQALKTSR